MYRRLRSMRGRSAYVGPGPVEGYDISAVVAAIRSHPTYGAAMSDTSFATAPNGLQIPTTPQGTLTTRNVSSLTDLRTYAAMNGQNITLAPGVYTETSATPAILVTGKDVRVTLTGCTVTGHVNSKVLQISGCNAERVQIIGGDLHGGHWIHAHDVWIAIDSLTGLMDDANEDASSGGEIGGDRILWIGSVVRDMTAGFFFTAEAYHGEFTASISGTTMTVTSMNGTLGADAGTIRIGDTIERRFGGTTGDASTYPLRGTKILSQTSSTEPGGALGGRGTYEVSRSQTKGPWPFRSQTISTNLILANVDAEAPYSPPMRHENVQRFNGVHLGLITDCRLWSGQKFTLRAHASYGYVRQPSKTVLFRNIQSEKIGWYADEPGPTDVHPAVEKIYMDNLRLYRAAGDDTGGLWSMPWKSQHSAWTVRDPGPSGPAYSGDGTTVTMVTDYEHGFTTGLTVDYITGCSPSSLDSGPTVVTVIDDYTFSYANTTTGSGRAGTAVRIGTPNVCVEYLWANGIRSYSAPPGGDEGTAGNSLTPSGYGGIAPGWSITDAQYQSYVTPPAWNPA